MKKSVLTAALLAFATLGVAQTLNQPVPAAQHNIYSKGLFRVEGKSLTPVTRRAETYSNWYNFTSSNEEGELLGQQLSGFVSFIAPDTLGHTVYSDGQKIQSGIHGVGSSFDPKDSNFAFTGEEVFSRFMAYTLDSIAFTQFYVRQVDQVDIGGNMVDVVDTVYIQYFNIDGITVGGYNYQSDPNTRYLYACPKKENYQASSLLNTSAAKTDTLFLTKEWADSVSFNGAQTSFFGRGIQIPVGIQSKSTNDAKVEQNITAFNVVFKPMVKPMDGDTLIAYDGSEWSKKYNMYGVRNASLQDHSQTITSPYRLNVSFVTNFEVLGGGTLFGFLRGYIPGTLFTSTRFFPFFAHITTETLSSGDLTESGLNGVRVYPNPSNGHAQVGVAFQLGQSAEVSVRVLDMNGRTVKQLPAKFFAAGVQGLNIETAGLNSGVYQVVLESAAGRQSAAMCIQ
jgi:hypothetical protein